MLVSRETSPRLTEFASAVARWNTAINLISNSTLPHLWDRHILDSAQLYTLQSPQARTWLDIGSGGGFPGLVIAILAADESRELSVTLVESDGRKAAFLRQMAQSLSLRATVITRRIENLTPQNADIISARAFAPLPDLCAIAARHLTPAGKALFLKGESYPTEVDAARRTWNFDLKTTPSTTNPASAVLEISALTKV